MRTSEERDVPAPHGRGCCDVRCLAARRHQEARPCEHVDGFRRRPGVVVLPSSSVKPARFRNGCKPRWACQTTRESLHRGPPDRGEARRRRRRRLAREGKRRFPSRDNAGWQRRIRQSGQKPALTVTSHAAAAQPLTFTIHAAAPTRAQPSRAGAAGPGSAGPDSPELIPWVKRSCLRGRSSLPGCRGTGWGCRMDCGNFWERGCRMDRGR